MLEGEWILLSDIAEEASPTHERVIRGYARTNWRLCAQHSIGRHDPWETSSLDFTRTLNTYRVCRNQYLKWRAQYARR